MVGPYSKEISSIFLTNGSQFQNALFCRWSTLLGSLP